MTSGRLSGRQWGRWFLCLTTLGVAACSPVDTEDASPEDASPGGALAVTRLLNLGTADAGFELAEVPRNFVFPADHGAHPGYRSEWWYLTAALEDAQGESYGLQFTVFRQALAPGDFGLETDPSDGWRSNQAYMAHFAITSVPHAEHRESQRFARGHPRLAGVRAAPFAAWVDGWSLAAIGDSSATSSVEIPAADGGFGRLALVANAPDAGIGAHLTLQPTRAPIAQGDRGLSKKGEASASYYYSLTRLAIDGSIQVDDEAVAVSGVGWFDREWSTSSLADDHVGWDWFALMLDDGQDVMAFRLRRRSGERDPNDYAMRLAASGAHQTYGATEFELQPVRWWRDDHGVSWPVGWQLDIGSEHLLLEAALDDQRMDTSIVYWEGLVHVTSPGGERIGAGYMELTGYAQGNED